MKKLLIPIFSVAVMAGCGTAKVTNDASKSSVTVTTVAKGDKAFLTAYKTITADDLKKNLYVIASDEMGGRDTGSPGQKKAGEYMINYYKTLGISSPKALGSYYQKVPADFMKKRGGGNLPDSENILAFIEGSEKPDKIVVVSAHYDHVGTKNGVVYNGADDDGSGTVAVMEIAKAFQSAKKAGNGPKRSILFLHVTGEEHGLFGSEYYTDNPVFPLANTVVDLNIDMIGRDDPENRGKQYVYVIGSEMLSSELKVINEAANKRTNNLELNYRYDDPNDSERLYYRSDHYNFAKNNLLCI